MMYEFIGCTNPRCPIGRGRPFCVALSFPHGKFPPIGSKIACGAAGPGNRRCRGWLRRVVSVPQVMVRKSDCPTASGDAGMASIGGQDVHFKFLDHKRTDPEHARDLSTIGKKRGRRGPSQAGLGNCRYDEKLGRMVVDVVSNTKDPLGKIERAKSKGDMPVTTTRIGQGYKIRARSIGRGRRRL